MCFLFLFLMISFICTVTTVLCCIHFKFMIMIMIIFTGYGMKVTGWGVVCLRAASRVQLFASAAMNGRKMRCCIISSCQSAATSETVKALLGMCHHVKYRTFYVHI